MMIQFHAVPFPIKTQAQIPVFSTNASNSFPTYQTTRLRHRAPPHCRRGPPLPPMRYLRSPYTHEVRDGDKEAKLDMVASATAVAAVLQRASTSLVEFVYRIEQASAAGGGDGGGGAGQVLPSVNFLRLCVEQLALFRRIVHPEVLLSVSDGMRTIEVAITSQTIHRVSIGKASLVEFLVAALPKATVGVT